MTGLGYKFISIDYGQLSITVVHQYINFWYTSFYIFQIYYADSLWKYSFVFLITSLHTNTHTNALRGKCPNTELFLVGIFPHLDWILRDTKYLSVFSPNTGKYGPQRTPYLHIFHAVTHTPRIFVINFTWLHFCH